MERMLSNPNRAKQPTTLQIRQQQMVDFLSGWKRPNIWEVAGAATGLTMAAVPAIVRAQEDMGLEHSEIETAGVDTETPLSETAFINYCGEEETLSSTGPSSEEDLTTAIIFKNLSSNTFNVFWKHSSGAEWPTGLPLGAWNTQTRPATPYQLFIVRDGDGNCVFATYPLEQSEQLEVGTPENPWPERIGDFERDGIIIINRGTRIGVVDNQVDPQNNWQGIVSVRQRYAPNDSFRFYFYDNPEDVPEPAKILMGSGGKSRVPWGRITSFRAPDGVWEQHISIPYPQDQRDRIDANKAVTSKTLQYMYQRDTSKDWAGTDFVPIFQQQRGFINPNNTSLFVVYSQ